MWISLYFSIRYITVYILKQLLLTQTSSHICEAITVYIIYNYTWKYRFFYYLKRYKQNLLVPTSRRIPFARNVDVISNSKKPKYARYA